MGRSEDESRQVSTREDLLTEALGYVTRDRNSAYGNPEDNFGNIAGLWREYLRGKDIEDLNAADVAAMMILMKVARLKYNPAHRDSWVDTAGYAACGGEAAGIPRRALGPISPPPFKPQSDIDVLKGVADKHAL